jgi:hypothetical protein
MDDTLMLIFWVAVLLFVLFYLLVFLLISTCLEALRYKVFRRHEEEHAAFEAFAARVGSGVNPDRIVHLYNKLSQQGRDFIKNRKDFEETERGLASRVVKWR